MSVKEKETDLYNSIGDTTGLSKKERAELIKRAKGESRTMVEFAEKCGVITASSFSRIMHGNMTKPLSRELIDAIFINAVPTANLTYEELMRANGMIPADSPVVKNLDANISNRKFLEDQKNGVYYYGDLNDEE